ncbi:MAG: type IV secretion system protein VirB3 [Methylotenera sp.]|nr:type IV secretion system protein VirB3 [Methylotenera sp.]
MQNKTPQKDILFVAMTRVPTILGVPYVAFVLELMFASVVNIVSGNPLYALFVIPVHLIFYMIAAHDPGIFSEIEVWSKTIGRCLNRRFWGAASFSPLVTRKWQNK